MNWCDETKEPYDTNYPDDQPKNINFINDQSFNDGFGRILLEEEPWEQKEYLVDEPIPSYCAINIPETKEQQKFKIYKRRFNSQPSFLDKRK